MNKNPLEAIFGIFNKLTIQQKMIIGGVTALTIVLLGVLVVFLNEPNYTPLFSGLAEEDASKVIEQLNNDKIPFQIDDNGRTIKVPKNKVYETRLNLAGKGIPSSGVIGYELFDKNTMGMSDFMQKLNYKRALEGELARTIVQQEGIAAARVHITLPQRSVFKDEEKLPTASVVLKLKGNNTLSKGNVLAIVNLVSSSVEGLLPTKVTLLDNKGHLLSKENDDDPLSIASTKQYEVKQNVENYLASKAQTILDNVVGYGNAMIQVNADINFDQVEKTLETYDPESQVAVSEQSIKMDNSGESTTDSTVQTSENSTVNYEISKSIERVIQGSGNIKKLTIAAVINDNVKEVKKGDQVTTVSEPRNEEQLKKIEDIIKNAVGYDLTRNDQLSVVNMSFETKEFEEIKEEEPTIIDQVDNYSNIILLVAGIIAAALVLKSLLNKVKNEKIIIGSFNPNDLAMESSNSPLSLESPSSMSSPAPMKIKKKTNLQLGDIEDEISDEAVRKKAQQDRITSYVSKNPVDAAKLINSWLHEDEY